MTVGVRQSVRCRRLWARSLLAPCEENTEIELDALRKILRGALLRVLLGGQGGVRRRHDVVGGERGLVAAGDDLAGGIEQLVIGIEQIVIARDGGVVL